MLLKTRMPLHQLNPNAWVDLYADYLFNFTVTRINNRELAKDLVQDTFLSALKAKDSFKGKSSERTWLTSILKYKIIDYYRRINSQKGKSEIYISYNKNEDGNWLEGQIADEMNKNADGHLENKELGQAINLCLKKLQAKQAEAFKMKTILGYKTETICNELKITPSNLWVIIHRARLAMVNCLKENWFLL